MWLLVKKELRLQQLTFAVSGLYLIGWVSLMSFRPMAPELRVTLLFILTIFHSGAIPLLAGSMASAEERQLGTLEWQVLLPMARWKQWSDESRRRAGRRVGLDLGFAGAAPLHRCVNRDTGRGWTAYIGINQVHGRRDGCDKPVCLLRLRQRTPGPSDVRTGTLVMMGFTALYYCSLVLVGIDDVGEVVLDVAPTGDVWRGAVEILYMSLLDVLAIVMLRRRHSGCCCGMR